MYLKYVCFSLKLLSTAFLSLVLHGCIGIGILGIGDLSTSAKVQTLSNKKMLTPYQDEALSSIM